MVAHYAENLNWLGNLPTNIQQTVYDKNPSTVHAGATPLPNVGREAHTYLTHITERYNSLSEWTIFCQGKPFDHAYDFKKRLKAWAESNDSLPNFEWLGHIIDTDDANGERLFISRVQYLAGVHILYQNHVLGVYGYSQPKKGAMLYK